MLCKPNIINAMELAKIAMLFAVLLVLFGIYKIAQDMLSPKEPQATTTTSSTTTSSSTTSSSSSSSTSSSTSSTTYKIDYTTTLWGSCSDGVKNQDEVGVDCGGVCAPCEIICTKNEDCGEPHQLKTVCIGGDVYRPLVEYECLSPWMVNSSCRIIKRFVLVEKCLSSQECAVTAFEAECVRDQQKW